MKVFFLGTNGWYDTETGNTICILIDAKDRYIIFDAGNGLYKIDKYIHKDKPIFLFLSHYHLDHIIGFHVLNKFHFHQGIDVYGPPGLKTLFRQVINEHYTIPISGLKIKIRLHEVLNPDSLPGDIECRPLKHSIFCYGYRLLLENKIISYCTDTGICRNLFYLAKNSDLFITECAYKSGQISKEWPHLNPESASRVAKESHAKKLVLVHFDAFIYKTLKERKEAQRIARYTFKHAISAYDNLKIEI
jgi:ribonuclease BN (tRNA processing enzyme)